MGSRTGSACKNVGAIRKPVISMLHSARKMCLVLGALMVQCGIVSHSCLPISLRADASRQQETCRAGVIPLKANGEQWTPRLRSFFRVRGKRLGVSVREVSPNRSYATAHDLVFLLAIMLSKGLGEDSSVGDLHGFGEAIPVVRNPREERSTSRTVSATLLHRMFESPAKMVVTSVRYIFGVRCSFSPSLTIRLGTFGLPAWF